MATRYWEGKAAAVAQVSTATVGGTLSGETFTISVNGVDIASHTDSTTTIADTVAALVAAWNASTHPYATGITAADNSPVVTLTADTAGRPFDITLNTPGGDATFAEATTTANAGPNDWATADNWSGETVPVNGDTVIIAGSDINICWGLDQSAVELATLQIYRSYTGRIGLDRSVFATSADGETTSSSAVEYYEDYLTIGWNDAEVGIEQAPGAPATSDRLKLYNDETNASTTVVHSVGTAAAEQELPALRMKFAHASANVYIRSAVGGVGFGVDQPGETFTMGKVSVSASGAGHYVYVGDGVTFTTWEQRGGTNRMNAAATVTTVKVLGGVLYMTGDYTVTTLYNGEIYSDAWYDRTGARYGPGGTIYANNVPSSGNAITTAHLYGGTTSGKGCNQSRTWDTVIHRLAGAKLDYDEDEVTINTLSTI